LELQWENKIKLNDMKLVREYLNESYLDYDFEKPNPKILAAIDSYFQNLEGFENRWDRLIGIYYPNDGSGSGWSGVEKDDPDGFLNAWITAIDTMENKGVTQKDIINSEY
jgi:hypothetical protein